jgi:hypothetical protein
MILDIWQKEIIIRLIKTDYIMVDLTGWVIVRKMPMK